VCGEGGGVGGGDGRAGANSVVRTGSGWSWCPNSRSLVPDPLGHQLPALLSPGRMAAPPVGIDLLVFICEHRLKGTAMKVQLDDFAGGKPRLAAGG
jgi:hypothetical protein